MTKLRKILNKLYITVQSFLLIISAGLLMCGAVAIFHDVFVLKMGEKKACFEALTEISKVKTGTWRDSARRVPSVEEAKKCGVSYRTPEKLEFPFIDNQWAAWNLDGYLEKIDIQYNILLVFIFPLPLVLFLFGLRRWLIWMAKD